MAYDEMIKKETQELQEDYEDEDYEGLRTLAEYTLNIYGEEKEGDFYENGLLHCGICKEAKVLQIDGNNGKPFKVGRACRCIRREREEAERRLKEEQRKEEIEKYKTVSGIIGREQNLHFSDLTVTDNNRKIIEICSDYVDNFKSHEKAGEGFIFYGDVGTGKTIMAEVIINTFIERYAQPAKMVQLTDIIQLAIDNGTSYNSFIATLSYIPLLVVDDLGVERKSDFAIEKITQIVDKRYKSFKPTIYTTNLSVKAMEECEDMQYRRIYDRILDRCKPIRFKGKSMRGRTK